MTDTTEHDEFLAAFAEATGETLEPSTEGTQAEEPSLPAAETVETTEQQAPAAVEIPAATEGAETVIAPDIWANASAEQRAAFEAANQRAEQAEHRAKSDEGRFNAYQRDLAVIRRQTRTLGDTLAKGDDLSALVTGESWEKVKSEYGEDLAPILTALETIAQQRKSDAEQFQQLSQELVAADYDDNEAKLAEIAPDWQGLFARPDFAGWLDSKPAMYRETLAKNWDAVTDPAGVAEVASRFRDELTASGKLTPSHMPTPSPEPLPIDPKRAAQLEGARVGKVNSPPVGDTADSFEALFNQRAQQLERAQARR